MYQPHMHRNQEHRRDVDDLAHGRLEVAQTESETMHSEERDAQTSGRGMYTRQSDSAEYSCAGQQSVSYTHVSLYGPRLVEVLQPTLLLFARVAYAVPSERAVHLVGQRQH